MVTYNGYDDQLIHRGNAYDIPGAEMITLTKLLSEEAKQFQWKDSLLRRNDIDSFEDRFTIDDRFIWIPVHSDGMLAGYVLVPRS